MHTVCVLWPLTFLVLGGSASVSDQMWHQWKTTQKKVYDNQTAVSFRRDVWQRNMNMVLRHNQRNLSFSLGLNHLADMTAEEVNEKLNRLNLEDPVRLQNVSFKNLSGSSWLPQTVDWRTKGLVSPVQNQGLCGSCWAFSALGALEGQMKKQSGLLVPLSPQNLVDCSTQDGNHGCRGGFISRAFRYVIRNQGVDSEKFYPYEHQNGKCRYSIQGRSGSCSDSHVLPHGDEDVLQRVVASVGPVAVAVNAMLPSFHLYRGGLYDVPNCDPRFINHAVLVVGYGTDRGQDYWLVKNSWGTAWGEEGFIRLARNKKNLCGIASLAVYPTL